jgi:hypothetical protein
MTLRKTLGQKDKKQEKEGKKMHNEEFNNQDSSPNIIRAIEAETSRKVQSVACVVDNTHTLYFRAGTRRQEGACKTCIDWRIILKMI